MTEEDPQIAEGTLKEDSSPEDGSRERQKLLNALHAFHEANGTLPDDFHRMDEKFRAVCDIVLAGLSDSDSADVSPAGDSRIPDDLKDLKPDDPPEVHWAGAWLKCAQDDPAGESVELLVSLADRVFGPARFLAFRTLVRMGRRRDIMRLIPEKGALSLYEADALLETGALHLLVEGWTDRIALNADSLISATLSQQWIALLDVEATLATAGASGDMETRLANILSHGGREEVEAVEKAFHEYVLSRAAAALARVCIDRRRDAAEVLDSGAAEEGLPHWERSYLRGLSHLALGAPDAAKTHLEEACLKNPRQGAVGMALAGIVARRHPEEGLKLLESAEPTRELKIFRAVLLTRCRRYEEALACLQTDGEKGLPREPARLFWPAGRKDLARQAQALETALLEQKGEWQRASHAWARIGPEDVPATLLKARAFYQAKREEETLLPHQSWRRSVLSQSMGRSRHELGQALLNRESLFFWAAAILPEDPETAVKGFQRLLKQRKWVMSQQALGADRLVYMGDVLLQKGHPADAVRAYALAADADHPDVGPRLEVAEALLGYAKSSDSNYPPEQAEDPSSYYPTLLTAMERIAAGEKEAAASSLSEAESRDAPEPVCRFLRRILEKKVDPETLTETEISGMKLPPFLEAVLKMMTGPGEWGERLKAFAEARGKNWIGECPFTKHAAAAALLNHLCREGEWDEVMEQAGLLTTYNDPEVGQAAMLARVRVSLRQALDDDLEGAEERLLG